MLPMLELATEHVQLNTTCHMNHVPPCCMNFSHTPLEIPSLNNVLPAMVLQNRLGCSNIQCSSCTSPHSRVCHVALSPAPIAPTCLGRRVVRVVVILLLLISGDIETNPGPVGEYTSLIYTQVCPPPVHNVTRPQYTIPYSGKFSNGANFRTFLGVISRDQLSRDQLSYRNYSNRTVEN